MGFSAPYLPNTRYTMSGANNFSRCNQVKYFILKMNDKEKAIPWSSHRVYGLSLVPRPIQRIGDFSYWPRNNGLHEQQRNIVSQKAQTDYLVTYK